MGQVGLHCATANSSGNIRPCAAPCPHPWPPDRVAITTTTICTCFTHESTNPAARSYGSWASTSPSSGCTPPLVICGHRRMVCSIKFTPHLRLNSMIPPLLRHQPPAPAVHRQTRLPQSLGCWLAFYPTIPLVCANRTFLHLTWPLICSALTANRTLKSYWIIACSLF